MKFNVIVLALVVLGFSYCKSKKDVVTSSTATESKSTVSKVQVDVVEGLNLGNKAPEFEMANTQGELLKLSSFKGKMVLIDFWASWCGPCRQENPTVVATYHKYNKGNFKNGKGFEILSVSLDSNKDSWMKAIDKDQLVWPYHVSDLQGWNNAVAKKYGVNSIPTNFLVDGNGIIIAKNLRGTELDETIQQVIKLN